MCDGKQRLIPLCLQQVEDVIDFFRSENFCAAWHSDEFSREEEFIDSTGLKVVFEGKEAHVYRNLSATEETVCRLLYDRLTCCSILPSSLAEVFVCSGLITELYLVASRGLPVSNVWLFR